MVSLHVFLVHLIVEPVHRIQWRHCQCFSHCQRFCLYFGQQIWDVWRHWWYILLAVLSERGCCVPALTTSPSSSNYTRSYNHSHTYIHTHKHTQTYTYRYTYTRTHRHTHTHTHTNIHRHTHTDTHTHKHTDTHIHIHTQTHINELFTRKE